MDIKAAEKKTSCVGQFLEKVTDFMNRHRKIRFAIDFLLTLLIMVVISAKLGFWLEGNDDNTIAYVVSGHLSETPQPSLYFANAILGFFISTLYRITSSIPWYGLFILISIFACILFPLHAAEQRCKTVGGYCLVMLVGAFTIASILKQIVFAQFTTISALLAIAGYFCLIMYRKKKAKYISFILFQLFSYLLRRASMLMVQPIGYACFVAITVGIILYQAKKEKKFTEIVKEIARQIIPIFLIVIGITGVCRCVDRLVYSTDEWENANKIEDFRCQISDFSDPPAYEEVYDILAKYDISEVEYEMLKSTRIFESDKYADAAAELVDYMKQNATEETEKLTVLQMLRYVFVDSYKEHTANGNDLLVYHYLQYSGYDFYFQLFATASYLQPETIRECYEELVNSTEKDSILTVVENHSFYWLAGNPINYRPCILPRSQDMLPVFEETTGLYGIKAEALEKYRCRIGAKPILKQVSKFEAVDINTEEDLKVAEYVGHMIYGYGK